MLKSPQIATFKLLLAMLPITGESSDTKFSIVELLLLCFGGL